MLSESQIRNFSIQQLSVQLGLNIKRLSQGNSRNQTRYVLCDENEVIIGYLGANRKEVARSILSCFSLDELKKGAMPTEERAIEFMYPDFDLDEFQSQNKTYLGDIRCNKNSVANLTLDNSLCDYIRSSYLAKMTGDI